MKPMKLHIIGGPGSGKSYLASYIARITGCTHCNLDDLFWENTSNTFGVKADTAKRDDMLKSIVSGSLWIVEGVYYGWVADSFNRADEIVILKTNVIVRDFRILKRFILRKLGLVECKKKETLKGLYGLLKWNHSYENNISDILKITDVYSSKRVIVSTKKEMSCYIEKIKEATSVC